MAKPSGADYQAAFQNPRSAFSEPELQQAQPATNRLGLPKLMSGNFAVVGHLNGSGETWAIRAFVRDVPNLQQRYQLISACLDGQHHEDSPFVGFRYVADGIRVNGQWHPIVIMDWVPGVQLDTAIGERIHTGQSLKPLIESWARLITNLESMQVAHGDLQHGNILVDGDHMRLVDYDGMFVPAMTGMPFSEQGHSNYQHPERARHGFNAELDRFSALLILTAMKALEHDPSLWQRTRMPNDNLLFRKQEDFLDPTRSPLLSELLASPDPEVRMFAGVLRDSLATGGLPPLVSGLVSGRPAVVRSTTDTTGWWRTSTPEPNADGSATSVQAQSRIGAGWIRALVGASEAANPDSGSPQSGQQPNPLLQQVPFVASFNRIYVHRSTCDWARQISWRNLIGFESLDAALASGYKPCKTCKPQQLRQAAPPGDANTGNPSASNGSAPSSSRPMQWITTKVREHIRASGRSGAQPPTHQAPSRESIRVGSQVKLQPPKGNMALVRVVRAGTSTPTISHVPEDSPLGRALMGKEAGEAIVYREMGKVFRFTILEVI